MMENVQALQAIGVSQQVAANNVANMNTNGFHSSRVDYATGPDGRGVRVQDIVENSAAGPLVPDYVDGEPTLVEGSNTDLATEMVQMIQNETSFEANVAALRTENTMTGALLDLMV